MADSALTSWHDYAADKSLVATQDIGPTIALTRATDKAIVNSGGLIEIVASGVAGFDHNPISFASLGLSIEEARTNIYLRNRNLEHASWTKTRVTIDQNDDAGPSGDSTADKVVMDGSAATSHRIRITLAFDGASPYSVSGYAKQDEMSQILASLDTAAFPASVSAYFDFSDNTVVSTGGGEDEASIEAGPNGYSRWLLRSTSDAAGGTTTTSLAEGGSNVVDGDSVSGAFLVGFQAEVGTFSLSLIWTDGAAVTRNKDVYSTADVSFLGAANTFYFDFSTGNIDNDTTVFAFHDTTANERIVVEITGGNIHFIGVDGGVTQWDISQAAVANTDYKGAVAWAVNDIAFYLNGAQVGVDGGATLPTVTTLNIGSDHADAEQLNSNFKEDRTYNERKPNQFLEDLSNGLINERAAAGSGLGLAFGKMGMGR